MDAGGRSFQLWVNKEGGWEFYLTLVEGEKLWVLRCAAAGTNAQRRRRLEREISIREEQKQVGGKKKKHNAPVLRSGNKTCQICPWEY